MPSGRDLQAIALAKLEDAQLLLDAGRYSNAYYLAGYAVEVGLKAAIAKQFLAGVIPDRAFVNNVHTHDLSKLLGLAGLSEALAIAQKAPQFAANWLVTSQWSEASRYEMIDVFRARELVAAVGDEGTGVFQWLKPHW
jgi:HEPN domain-containing protein